MNLKKLTIVPMLAMALFAVGCGDDCVSTCEEGNECEGAEKEDCDKLCEDLAKDAEDAGCEDQYDDVVSCMSDLDDICKFDITKDCTSEYEAYGKCAAE